MSDKYHIGPEAVDAHLIDRYRFVMLAHRNYRGARTLFRRILND